MTVQPKVSLDERDQKYREKFLTPIRVCADYRPAFGTSSGDVEINLSEFQKIFGTDPLYSWLGLDSSLMYAAHKAAGGMTSIYRQVGIGCERLVREVISDELGLSQKEVTWSYSAERTDGKTQTLTLDARVDQNHLHSLEARQRFDGWLTGIRKRIDIRPRLTGAVFEVRQGYKSADSKRQNADLRFGLAAYNEAYLPCIMVISTQVSASVIRRYQQNRLLVLTGTLTRDPFTSTFAFFEEIVGYPLQSFFERNTTQIRSEMTDILRKLLSAD